MVIEGTSSTLKMVIEETSKMVISELGETSSTLKMVLSDIIGEESTLKMVLIEESKMVLLIEETSKWF